MTDKIVKGAGTHRILLALRERPRTSKQLKLIVGAVNSLSRFDGEYMVRLESNGYVFSDDGHWHLTVKGHQKIVVLGDIHKPEVAMPRTVTFSARREDPPPVLRPGCMDYTQWPSRRGNYLYYRDGRVEVIE